MKGLIFTYALTYGGAVLSLLNPFHGLLIYIAFATLKPESLWPWSVPEGNYSRIVAIALLAGWALHGFGNRSFGIARPFAVALLGYWLWIIVSALFAADQSVAWNFVELHSKILLPVFVGLTLVESVAQMKQLAWVLVASLGFLAWEANLDYLQGGSRVRLEGFANMDNNCFCIAMAAGAGLSFFLGLHERAWWKKALCLALAAMMVHATMFGNSRGGMLGIVITAIATLVLIPKKPFELSLVAAAALIGLRLAGPQVWERFSTIFASADARDFSAGSRLQLWADCWDVMQKHPLTGVGPDHWPLTAVQYGWPPGKESHSLWFNAGAELGFPGLMFLVLFYGSVLWQCWRADIGQESSDGSQSAELREEPADVVQDSEKSWFIGCRQMVTAALVGFTVSASFVSLDGLEAPYYIALLGAGTLKVLSPAAGPLTESLAAVPTTLVRPATSPQAYAS
jgi:probable O-glycosylation ligase (exosortase A-associated)